MKTALTIVLALCICGCQGSSAGGVDHVVICWLKNPGDETARQRLIDESHKFEQIPGVMSVAAGRPLPSTRPVVDSSFDVGIVIQFADEAALRAYDQHPIHKKTVSDVLRPLTAKVLIYDIKRGDAALRKDFTKR